MMGRITLLKIWERVISRVRKSSEVMIILSATLVTIHKSYLDRSNRNILEVHLFSRSEWKPLFIGKHSSQHNHQHRTGKRSSAAPSSPYFNHYNNQEYHRPPQHYSMVLLYRWQVWKRNWRRSVCTWNTSRGSSTILNSAGTFPTDKLWTE